MCPRKLTAYFTICVSLLLGASLRAEIIAPIFEEIPNTPASLSERPAKKLGNADAGIIAISTFDENAEGWIEFGDKDASCINPDPALIWNSAGYVTSDDKCRIDSLPNTCIVSGFQAPSDFWMAIRQADISEVYGGTVQFKLKMAAGRANSAWRCRHPK
jgi:hypothetical protein